MQKVLELVLEGPMASWTNNQRQENRLTDLVPTRSAIIGLIACALGRERSADNSDLENLHIEILSSTYGAIETDFQTVRGASYDDNPYSAPNRSFDTITRQALLYVQYVTEAKYRIAIKGSGPILEEIAWAIQHPHWQLYLGRRANTLSRPPFVALRDC